MLNKGNLLNGLVKKFYLCFDFQWEEGDFIISDNCAVGHEASPETQTPRSKVGLRVLHRTTVHNPTPPAKS